MTRTPQQYHRKTGLRLKDVAVDIPELCAPYQKAHDRQKAPILQGNVANDSLHS